MALDGDILGDDILNAIDGVPSFDPKTESITDYRKKIWKAIAGAIVDHIKNNAEVRTTVTVASVSGVSPGTGSSGPGTGIGEGNIS